MKKQFIRALYPLTFLGLMACSGAVTYTTPEVRTITSAVYASGSVEPQHQYQVFAPTSGILNQKMVEAGDTVRKDQPLFIISQQTSDLQLENAWEQLSAAKRNASETSNILRDLNLQQEAKKEKYINDSVNYTRQQNLIKNKATSQSIVDQSRLDFLSSKSAYQSAVTNFQQRETELQTQLREARINYQLAAEEKGNTVVKSRIDGKVFQTFIKEGEMVSASQPLAAVGDQNSFMLELLVDERDISKLEPGMQVLFTTDLFPDTTLKAEVAKIYPYMNEQNRSFQVDASLTQSNFRFYDGASVEANIVVSQKKNAMVIPRSALIGEDSVMIEEDGESKKVKIIKGIENMEMVEVLSGLNENSKLISQR